MQLALLRATIAPGVVAPPHVHPDQLIVAVESGSVAYTILDENGESGRGQFGTPTAAEVIPPGTEVILALAEWIIEEPGIVHTFRNPGDEPLVLLVSASSRLMSRSCSHRPRDGDSGRLAEAFGRTDACANDRGHGAEF